MTVSGILYSSNSYLDFLFLVVVVKMLLIFLSSLPLPGPVTCPPNRWQCVGTSHCLNMTQVCDGNDDCGDNSDEGTHCCKCIADLQYPGNCTSCQITSFACTIDNDLMFHNQRKS